MVVRQRVIAWINISCTTRDENSSGIVRSAQLDERREDNCRRCEGLTRGTFGESSSSDASLDDML